MHNLTNRAMRRAGRVLRELLPYQQHFRPRGVHARSQELASRPDSGVTYREVYPATESGLEMSDAFYDALIAHNKTARHEQVPAAFALAIENGRVYADNPLSVAVIGPDDYLLGDVSFQYRRTTAARDFRPEDNNIFEQRYFRTPLRVAGTVCSLLCGGGAADGNYWHWLIDSLPRLHLLREAGLADSIDYYLVYDRRHPAVLETLALLGIRPGQVLDVRTTPHVKAERLLVTSPVRGRGDHTPRWACRFLHDSFVPLAQQQVTREFPPYVYINRRDTTARNVLNEPAVEAALAEYGIESFAMTGMPFLEQVALFSRAKVVVAVHGAGLTNLVFSPPGTPMLEFFPDSFVQSFFLELTQRLDQPYRHLVCPSPTPRHSDHVALLHAHLTVPVAELRRQLACLPLPMPVAAVAASPPVYA